MYALFTEVNADESHIEAARDFLPKVAVPMAREAGAKRWPSTTTQITLSWG